MADCLKKSSGAASPSTYARMGWDPAPTLTAQINVRGALTWIAAFPLLVPSPSSLLNPPSPWAVVRGALAVSKGD